jgi:hypothetical protein
MGALKPWHLLVCLIVVAALVTGLVMAARNSRRR